MTQKRLETSAAGDNLHLASSLIDTPGGLNEEGFHLLELPCRGQAYLLAIPAQIP